MEGGMKGNMDYITCEKRKNAPKINVLICEKKCEHAETCKPYLNYLKVKSVTAPTNECAPAEEDIILGKSSKIGECPPLAVGK